MKRIWLELARVGVFACGLGGMLAGGTACNKPTPDNCRKALSNMQRLMGTENLLKPAEFEGAVRQCRGGSTKESVECAINAQTLDALRACDFNKFPLPTKPVDAGTKPVDAASKPVDAPTAAEIPANVPAAAPADAATVAPVDAATAAPAGKPAPAASGDKPAPAPATPAAKPAP